MDLKNLAQSVNRTVKGGPKTAPRNPNARDERVAKNLAQLQLGKRVVSTNTDKHEFPAPIAEAFGVEKGTLLGMNPIQTLEKILISFKDGVTDEEILEAAPDLPVRFPWNKASEGIYTYTRQRKQAPNRVAQLLGLEEETTVIVEPDGEPEYSDSETEAE